MAGDKDYLEILTEIRIDVATIKKSMEAVPKLESTMKDNKDELHKIINANHDQINSRVNTVWKFLASVPIIGAMIQGVNILFSGHK